MRLEQSKNHRCFLQRLAITPSLGPLLALLLLRMLSTGWLSCGNRVSSLYSKCVVAVDLFVNPIQWSRVLVDKLINNLPHHKHFSRVKVQKLIEHFTLFPLICK